MCGRSDRTARTTSGRRLYVGEFRDGLLASVRQFELDDEEAAFAYAETLITPRPSRLAVTNRASEADRRIVAGDAGPRRRQLVGCYADRSCTTIVAMSGDPIEGRAGLRAALSASTSSISRFEGRTLAVRGERLALAWSRWSDDAGNETTSLHVFEVDEDGRIAYAGRFDEDDFEAAYRELERRYYAGEGAAFADGRCDADRRRMAANRVDLDRLFGDFVVSGLRFDEPVTLGAVPDRSTRSTIRAMASRSATTGVVGATRGTRPCVGSHRNWFASAATNARPIGLDGEKYEWTRLYVGEFRDGLAGVGVRV